MNSASGKWHYPCARWKDSRVAPLAAAAVLLLASVLIWSSNPRINPRMYGNLTDEEVLFGYAQKVSREGLAGVKAQFLDYVADPKGFLQLYPGPGRLTGAFFNVLAIRLWGERFESLQYMAFVFYLLLVAFAFYWARQWLGDGPALAIATLLAFSPLRMSLACRALSDCSSAFWMTAAFGAFVSRLLKDRASALSWLAVGLLYTAAMLTKETAAMLIPLSTAAGAWVSFDEKSWKPLGMSLAVPVGGLLAAAGIIYLFAGSPALAWRVMTVGIAAVDRNAFARIMGSGPWFRYWIDFIVITPWVVLAYLGWLGSLACALSRPSRAVTIWSLIPVAALFLMAPFTKNARYALWLEFPMILGAFLFIDQAARCWLSQKKAAIATSAAVALIAFSGLRAFLDIFMAGELYDPLTIKLLIRCHIIH